MTPRKRDDHQLPLLVVAVIAGVVIAARMVWPSLTFDSLSLTLFGVACGTVLLAFLPIKKLKLGDVIEIELDNEIDGLETKVTASEVEAPSKTPTRNLSFVETSARRVTGRQFYEEYSRIVSASISNVEKLLAAAIVLEEVLTSAARSHDPEGLGRLKSLPVLVKELAAQQLVTRPQQAAFEDYWAIRNKVIHRGMVPNNEQTARLLDLALRLVRTLA